MDYIETVIIGAGVVGLSVGRARALAGREVLILESEDAAGTATSSRNSGVIHAGIYYSPGSLKARLCVIGRDKLYAYAQERAIPHLQCGKLIVATSDDQIQKLREWQTIAALNGVGETHLLTPESVSLLEPEVFCKAALHVPVTGIIDVHPYIQALESDLAEAGGILSFQSKVVGIKKVNEGFVLQVKGSTDAEIACRYVVNAAGLGAQEVAHTIDGLDKQSIPPRVLAKGNYFSLTGKQPFSRLIYPLPSIGSSGLHACCDLSGRVRFGPDVEWVDTISYDVDPSRLGLFEAAVKLYWPALPAGALTPDYSGIRPKLAHGGPHDTDFVIQTAATHKVGNLICLYGIESPGLTSSLALGDYVTGLLED